MKSKFGDELAIAFNAAGVSKFCFKEMTPEQKEEIIQRQQYEEKAKWLARLPNKPDEKKLELDTLSTEEKFTLLYDSYPVKKERENALSVFRQMEKRKILPNMAALLKSVEEHKNYDRWWREHMPPLLVNYLRKKKWQDKPYE